MSNSTSYHDAISISVRLEPVLKSIAPSEIHLFAYLACLLALYRKRAVADWGYGFGAVKGGYPYSPELEESIQSLVNRGSLVRDDNQFLRVSTSGTEELNWLQTLSTNNEREIYISGACDSILSLPIGIIRDAINQSNDLHSARLFSAARHLPTHGGEQVLYDQFDVLSEAVGVQVQDLMIPAVVWLQFLASASIQNLDGHASI